jgi:hypothetical protein
MEKELVENDQESSGVIDDSSSEESCESQVSTLEEVRNILQSIYSTNPEVSIADVRETVKDIRLSFCDAIELDLQFTGHAGRYWAEAYGNPVEGQRIVASFAGSDSWNAVASDVGIFTFNFTENDKPTENW